MPKETKETKKYKVEDEFAKAEKTSFVHIPSIKLDTSTLANNFKSLNKNIIPSGKLDYDNDNNENNNNNNENKHIDKRPQLISKKDKRKQKKEAFLQKFNPSLKLQKKKQQDDDESNDGLGMGGVLSSIDLLKDSMKLQPKTKGPKLTNEKRKKMSLKEANQYKNVLSHPSFKANPFATLQEHLANSVALQNQKIKQEQDFKPNNNNNNRNKLKRK
ncbi:hypothetical protein DDB_G0282497 [Dictyostelium discoideum AX4]|uniref:Putative ribosome biogenesis protein slx9-like n=1 Tax=Dictyostelium discoideum TaxID=44689 RepID=SLX9_DICDI|nr:hypothetical protein DDB_G0282497 [Dictyostelium discoideum AX4]Q54SF5.1 RecName: Full=Putative ribosome biogenesis protein slx9-like [Dictyostelium discoideum]EAL66108.1 hypothetical protein DDB_G0282497 [Dictyostelium discoideum AX4]|eukprot:XP_640084.1 hypothetical protein DDB_G0282497 [Dictyostelium discoideum AX4]